MLTHERLLEALDYDSETGVFTWLVRPSNRVAVGNEAGVVAQIGYRYISIDGHKCLAHRLAWFYVHGRWPTKYMDHINCNRLDNRLVNLREADYIQNGANRRAHKNNTSGIKGVSWDASKKRWVAQLSVNRQYHFLGRYKSKEEAASAYAHAIKKHHGEFARVA
jgi:hypothetical protein